MWTASLAMVVADGAEEVEDGVPLASLLFHRNADAVRILAHLSAHLDPMANVITSQISAYTPLILNQTRHTGSILFVFMNP